MSSHWRSVSVEHVAFLSIFATALLEPISQQYIYNRILLDNHPSNSENSSQQYGNQSCANTSGDFQNNSEIFRKAFLWFLYLKLSASMPAVCVTALLGPWSDTAGRRVAFLIPSIGAMLQATVCVIILNFGFPFRFLFLGSLICGISGYTTTYSAACMAYVSDITSKSQRTFRVVIVNTAFGVGGGLAGFLSVYWLKSDRYLESLWLILAIHLFNTIYVALFLKETIIHEGRFSFFEWKHVLNMFAVFYQEPGNDRRWRLLAYTVAFAMSEIVISGTNRFLLYYAFSWPLCFSHLEVAYLSGALSLCFLSSLIGVRFLQMLPCCTNNWIIELGFLSYSGGLLLAAFANTSLMFFLGMSILMIIIIIINLIINSKSCELRVAWLFFMPSPCFVDFGYFFPLLGP